MSGNHALLALDDSHVPAIRTEHAWDLSLVPPQAENTESPMVTGHGRFSRALSSSTISPFGLSVWGGDTPTPPTAVCGPLEFGECKLRGERIDRFRLVQSVDASTATREWPSKSAGLIALSTVRWQSGVRTVRVAGLDGCRPVRPQEAIAKSKSYFDVPISSQEEGT